MTSFQRWAAISLVASASAFDVTDVGKNAPGDGIPDGLNDVWQNFFGAWGLDAADDDDGDGISNLAESIAGTNPNAPNDGLKIAGVQLAGESLVFTFVAEKGKTYCVVSADAPGGPVWMPVSGSAFLSTVDHLSHSISILRPSESAKFYRIEVQENDGDNDGVSDWSEWRRGTDAATLAEVEPGFAIASSDRPIFAESFTNGSRMGSDRMFVHGGFMSGLPGENWTQVAWIFDTPPDVRAGDIAVYWAFKSAAAQGPEYSKLYMYLNFTDVPAPPLFPEPARIAVNVRPAAWSQFYCDPGWQLPNDPNLAIIPPTATFPDPQTVEKFRMIVHWAGGDRVTATVEIWDRGAAQWQPFVLRDQPELGPVVMELSIAGHLFGSTVFKSLNFQAYDVFPELDSVLVTVRPPPPTPAPSSAAPARRGRVGSVCESCSFLKDYK